MESSALPLISNPSPFDLIADTYDDAFTETLVGRAQRRQVWQETDRHFQASHRIVELNCGTGADALHLAERGVRVLACDSSLRMMDAARRRVLSNRMSALVELRALSIEEILQLEPEGLFDGALSNFAGLNCVEDLSVVARHLARLLRPGAKALVCLFGSCCLWEMLWFLARGEATRAFRRFRRQGSIAHLGGTASVHVHYPTVREVRRLFAPHFHLRAWKGIGLAVPPSYLEVLAARYPESLRMAEKADRWLSRCPGIRGLADHVLLTFERGRA